MHIDNNIEILFFLMALFLYIFHRFTKEPDSGMWKKGHVKLISSYINPEEYFTRGGVIIKGKMNIEEPELFSRGGGFLFEESYSKGDFVVGYSKVYKGSTLEHLIIDKEDGDVVDVLFMPSPGGGDGEKFQFKIINDDKVELKVNPALRYILPAAKISFLIGIVLLLINHRMDIYLLFLGVRNFFNEAVFTGTSAFFDMFY